MYVEVINGLLGSGKTTFLLKLLEQKGAEEKVAVLVNEFGEIGLDGDLLSGQGADVVELPNGCICCTLNADLRNQVRVIAETYNPDRLIIEPTGVATIKNLMGILRSLSLEKYIDDIKITVIVDAGTFGETLTQNRGFVETQLEMAQDVVVNKCDKVSPAELNDILLTVKKVNNTGRVFFTTFGRVIDIPKGDRPHGHGCGCCHDHARSRESHDAHGSDDSHQHHHEQHSEHHHEHRHESDHDHEHHHESDHDHEHHHESDHDHEHHHELPLKNYEQFSRSSNGLFDLPRLRLLFAGLNSERFGSIDRAKGVFRVPDGRWVRFDLASREINEVIVEKAFSTSKIMIIGTGLKKDMLQEEVKKCLI